MFHIEARKHRLKRAREESTLLACSRRIAPSNCRFSRLRFFAFSAEESAN